MTTIQVQMREIVKNKGWHVDGREPENHSPGFDYCRKLLKQGYPVDTCLEVYRDDMLCLTFPSIGEGAKWAIKENKDEGPTFKKYKPFVPFKIAENSLPSAH